MKAATIVSILPKFPLIVKTIIRHVLRISEQSKYWDLRTAVTVRILFSFINESPPTTISKSQSASLVDDGVKKNMWVSKIVLPKPPEDNVRQVLFSIFEKLKEPGEALGGYREPNLLPVEAEWIGNRPKEKLDSPEPNISEEKKYLEMMRHVVSKTTILYFHGGAYYLMDPSTHRHVTRRLAELTTGRCLSVRYRLAPQNPFPAALLDGLIAYLSLLYPLPESLHSPVSPGDIVFSGDSAGGNLCFALLQFILEIQRKSLKITWNGEEREVPMPAGVACSSPWLDITSCMPSIKTNQKYDYLPIREIDHPACSIWPADPPRRKLFADDKLLTHPLVSPMIAKNWENSCPIYMSTGWELLADEIKQVAAKMAQQGVKVVYEDYEAMPHCFGLLLTKLPATKKYFEAWAHNITLMIDNPQDIVASGQIITAKTLKKKPIELSDLRLFTDEEVRERMQKVVKEIEPHITPRL